jgi:hypothetical protein
MTYSFNILYKGVRRHHIMILIILIYTTLCLYFFSTKNVRKTRKKLKRLEDTKFKIEKVPKSDIIIIGSNVSGLACGAALSKAGHNVLILEKEKSIGDSFVPIEKADCIFETSYQSVGSLRRLRPLMDWLTENQIWWQRINDIDNVFLSVNDEFKFYNSYHTTKRKFKNKNLWKHVNRYEQSEKDLYEKINYLYIPERLCCILQDICCKTFLEYRTISIIDFLTNYCDITNKKQQHHLIALCGTGPLNVLKNMDSTILLEKLSHYKHGAYYNTTGSLGIVNQLKDTILYHGSTILTEADVTEINKEGTIMVNGHEISARKIISALPYHKTTKICKHIENITEVKEKYNKIYGLLSVDEYKQTDKLIIDHDTVIRCGSTSFKRKLENNQTVTFEMVSKEKVDKETATKTFVELLKDHKVHWADITFDTLPLVKYVQNERPYTSDSCIYMCGKDMVQSQELLGELEAGYKTANLLCGYGTLLDMVFDRELMYEI